MKGLERYLELKKVTYDIDGHDYYVCPECESDNTEET